MNMLCHFLLTRQAEQRSLDGIQGATILQTSLSTANSYDGGTSSMAFGAAQSRLHGIGKRPYVWSLKLIYGRTFGETANIVMYDREISLLARFSKMTAHVRIFSYCKGLVEELFLGGARGKAESRGLAGKARILAPTPKRQALAKMGARRRSTVASPAGQTRLVPVVRKLVQHVEWSCG